MRFTIKDDEIEKNSGLDAKDVVVRIDGQNVDTLPDFDKKGEGPAASMLTQYANNGLLGSKVTLTVSRDGVKKDVVLTRCQACTGSPTISAAGAHSPISAAIRAKRCRCCRWQCGFQRMGNRHFGIAQRHANARLAKVEAQQRLRAARRWRRAAGLARQGQRVKAQQLHGGGKRASGGWP